MAFELYPISTFDQEAEKEQLLSNRSGIVARRGSNPGDSHSNTNNTVQAVASDQVVYASLAVGEDSGYRDKTGGIMRSS